MAEPTEMLATPPDRVPPYARQHSRSSSQVATLASLASLTSSLTLSPSLPPSPTRSQSGNQSPRFSISGLTGGGGFGNGNSYSGGIESPVYLSRSTTPEPSTSVDRHGRLSLDSNALGMTNSRSSSRVSLSGSTSAAAADSNGSLSPSHTNLPPIETTPTATTTTSLAQLIQQKRRQNSAPYFAAARSSSLFSPGAGFGISSITGSTNGNGMATERLDYAGAWGGGGGGNDIGRRTRSRQATRAGSLALNDEGGMVMTPTTAEWRQLGGKLTEIADIRAKDEAKIEASLPTDSTLIRSPVLHKSNHSSGANSISTTSSSSSISLNELGRSTTTIQAPTSPVRPLLKSIELLSDPLISLSRTGSTSSSTSSADSSLPSTKFRSTSFSYQSSRTGFTHSSSLSFDAKKVVPSTPPSAISSSTFVPSHRTPNLSRGSLSTTTVGTPTPLPGTPLQYPFSSSSSTQETSVPPLVSPLLEIALDDLRPLTPVELDWVKHVGNPVDPRRYSAFTGARGIDDFVVVGEAGKGAYGTVCKAREKGSDGLPFGPDLVIKYIIKQRILADCWKKHKILGPIPIEVHVLDHLRRVPYYPRIIGTKKEKPTLSRRESIAASMTVKEGMTTGHPNICGMLDFFEDGEFYYLVMPQAGTDPESPEGPRGQDLFEHVDANPDGLPTTSIRRILSQLAEALSFLHEHGIVHRDIKDENVVLDHSGNAQLIDFGSAAYVKEGKKFDTFSGTLDFAAPEVLKGARYGGKETDVWALGVLGYVITIGECPFWSPEEAIQGLTPDSRAELALRSKCPPVSVDSPTPGSPASISSLNGEDIYDLPGSGKIEDGVDLVMRCLEIDPEDRPTADQVLEHRFILGHQGWFGPRGWELEVEVEDSEGMVTE